MAHWKRALDKKKLIRNMKIMVKFVSGADPTRIWHLCRVFPGDLWPPPPPPPSQLTPPLPSTPQLTAATFFPSGSCRTSRAGTVLLRFCPGTAHLRRRPPPGRRRQKSLAPARRVPLPEAVLQVPSLWRPADSRRAELGRAGGAVRRCSRRRQLGVGADAPPVRLTDGRCSVSAGSRRTREGGGSETGTRWSPRRRIQ